MMDFALTEDQESVRDLARRIFTDQVTTDRLKEVESTAEGFDRGLWKELGKANLLGVAFPEEVGGSGYGLIELCLILEEAGRTAAPIPLVPALVTGGLPVAEFGTREQGQALAGLLGGESVLTGAFAGVTPADAATMAAAASEQNETWRLDGVVETVPVAASARRILVPARTEHGSAALFLVDPSEAELELQEITIAEPTYRVKFDDSSAELLVEGTDAIQWVMDRALVAFSVLQVGVCERALRMTAEYTSGRDQFGKPLASFQAVQQRVADAYIDVEAMRWTAWRAACRLAEGLPADEEIAVAKFWAAEAGQRVVAAAQHLHGGIGVDVDYPLHRYTKRAKQVELAFGGATSQLARLGDLIAEPAR
jgi:alkylation response protein AidB-like acyl-CoA dehydrogenase